MNHKFQFRICKGVAIDMDWLRFKDVTVHLPDGDYDLIVRKQISWDVAQMRKYFHGPALGFIVDQFRRLGSSMSKNQIKEYLKSEFGPCSAIAHSSIPPMPDSMADYDFETYKKFLTDVNCWCVECFNCELPPAEEVE